MITSVASFTARDSLIVNSETPSEMPIITLARERPCKVEHAWSGFAIRSMDGWRLLLFDLPTRYSLALHVGGSIGYRSAGQPVLSCAHRPYGIERRDEMVTTSMSSLMPAKVRSHR
jgi:nitrogen fixation protein